MKNNQMPLFRQPFYMPLESLTEGSVLDDTLKGFEGPCRGLQGA